MMRTLRTMVHGEVTPTPVKKKLSKKHGLEGEDEEEEEDRKNVPADYKRATIVVGKFGVDEVRSTLLFVFDDVGLLRVCLCDNMKYVNAFSQWFHVVTPPPHTHTVLCNNMCISLSSVLATTPPIAA
jgi:hypothetical protein